MTFACTIKRSGEGRWEIRHTSKDVGTLGVRANSREEALAKMKDELRYRLEMCPCTGEVYRNLEIEIVENR